MKTKNDPTFPDFPQVSCAHNEVRGRAAVAWRAVHVALLALPVLGTVSCWKTEFNTPQLEIVDFAPNAEAPAGWVVARQTVPLDCPDGEDASFLFVYPEAHPPDAPLPVALMFHSGSFDFVYEADPQTPLTGLHYATPSRLDSGWAVKAAFSTLGMYPSEQPEEVHDGTLAAGFASRGYGMLLPTNCWGDLWHNMRGQMDNDYSRDFFYRDGRAAAQWGYSTLMTEGFSDAIGLEMPFIPDRERVVWVGLGEGSRAVQELLTHPSLDVMEQPPQAVLMDSPIDDLGAYAADPTSYASQLEGVARLFGGAAPVSDPASLTEASTLPERFAFVYSPSDPLVPTAANLNAIGQLTERDPSTMLVTSIDTAQHVLTNGYDETLTDEVLLFLLGENTTTP